MDQEKTLPVQTGSVFFRHLLLLLPQATAWNERKSSANFASMCEQVYDFGMHVQHGEQYYGQPLRQIN
ncbi:hypothetical protein [Janthinobacterium sp. HLX7-2]|uniref:hypothetical protein n=1 Tax=Janthinobacterium sp. HLX7-2 TaxID=1259331 RepID=UPI003F1F2233